MCQPKGRGRARGSASVNGTNSVLYRMELTPLRRLVRFGKRRPDSLHPATDFDLRDRLGVWADAGPLASAGDCGRAEPGRIRRGCAFHLFDRPWRRGMIARSGRTPTHGSNPLTLVGNPMISTGDGINGKDKLQRRDVTQTRRTRQTCAQETGALHCLSCLPQDEL